MTLTKFDRVFKRIHPAYYQYVIDDDIPIVELYDYIGEQVFNMEENTFGYGHILFLENVRDESDQLTWMLL